MVTDVVPLRVYIAEMLRDEGRRHHLELILSSKKHGSLEALAEVDSTSNFKLALIPGGVKSGEYPTVRVVTTLMNEPLHMLARPELVRQGIRSLIGKRVNIGPKSNSAHHLAREVLEFAGLTPNDTPGTSESGQDFYTPDTASPDEIYEDLARINLHDQSERINDIQSLPDAVVFLEPIPSRLAKRLAQVAGYQIFPLPFAEAFCLDRLNPPNSDGVKVDRSLLKPGMIPPFLYGSDPTIPAEPCPTIVAPLLLVAQNDTDAEAVFRLLETIYDSPLTNVLRPPPLQDQMAPFPFQAGTERYLKRNEPFLTPETAAKLGTLAGGIGALISGLIAFYSFIRLQKLRRFEFYYREIGRIDRIAQGLETDPNAPTDRSALRPYLENQLSALRSKVLGDFAEGGLKGEGLLNGIIALINDTRDSLAGMLAQRDLLSSQTDSVPSVPLDPSMKAIRTERPSSFVVPSRH